MAGVVDADTHIAESFPGPFRRTVLDRPKTRAI